MKVGNFEIKMEPKENAAWVYSKLAVIGFLENKQNPDYKAYKQIEISESLKNLQMLVLSVRN